MQHFTIDANSNFNILMGNMEGGSAYSDSGGGNVKLMSTGTFGGLYDLGNTNLAIGRHLNQDAAKNYAGSCSMSTSTTCTFTVGAAFTGTPLCFASLDAVSSVPVTAVQAKCGISGTTVTITAGGNNSLTWDALLIGNPN